MSKNIKLRILLIFSIIMVTTYAGACGKSSGGSSAGSSAAPAAPSTGWGTAGLVETGDIGPIGGDPRVAIDANGNAIAVWQQGNNTVKANRYVAGAGWGTPTDIQISTDPINSVPQIAMDANGNAIAVWSQKDGLLPYNIYQKRYTVISSWNASSMISDGLSDASASQIAVSTNGDAMAVWSQDAGSGQYNAMASSYSVTTTNWTRSTLETNAGVLP